VWSGGIRVAFEVHGRRELWRTLDRASDEIRKRVATAVAFTAQEVALGARARVPKRSGELADTIRAEPSTNPFVWFVKAGYGKLPRRRTRAGSGGRRRPRVTRVEAPGVYAAVVEYGSQAKNIPAQPFMYPALEASYSRHVARLARAMQDGATAGTRGVR
jgi:hypothetical protein